MKTVFNSIPLYQPVNEHLEHYFTSADQNELIPTLEKQAITESFPDNYMTDRIKQAINDGDIEYASTSGTSSEKLMLMRPKDWWFDEFQRGYDYCPAMTHYSMTENKKICLSTAVCSANTCFMDNPSYDERIIGNTLYLNAQPDPYLWTKDDILKFDAEMKKFAGELLEVDPVYLAIYLKKREEFGIDDELYQPQFITCSYEFLTQAHREYIERYYQCPVLSMYGSTELGVLFIQDEQQVFHRCPERSILELLPFDADRNLYELVVTSWKNEFMPLLRYRTKDIVELSDDDAKFYSELNKYKFMEHESVKIKSLHGRLNDVFWTDSGTPVTVGELDQSVQACTVVPWQYQLEIDNDRITFRYVMHDTNQVFSAIENFSFLKEWFSKTEHIDFVAVKSIRNEGSGKYRIVCGNNLKRGGN